MSYTHEDIAEWPAISSYRMQLDRTDLIPDVIIRSKPPDLFEHYEPFIIAEGWREESAINGPFLVAQDRVPSVDFDEYDQATIGLYE